MDVHVLLLFNAWLSVAMFLATLGAIIDPRVKDKIIIKFGLIFMCLGYMGCASTLLEGQSHHLIVASWILTNLGLLIAIGGWLLRGYLGYYGPRRRRADILRSVIFKDNPWTSPLA